MIFKENIISKMINTIFIKLMKINSGAETIEIVCLQLQLKWYFLPNFQTNFRHNKVKLELN